MSLYNYQPQCIVSGTGILTITNAGGEWGFLLIFLLAIWRECQGQNRERISHSHPLQGKTK